MAICSVDGCGKKVHCKGYCGKHYIRNRKFGDPLGGIGTHIGEPVQWLNDHVNYQGDECLTWPFEMKSTGYGVVRFNGRKTNANRAMCILARGEPPEPEMQAAHSCGNGHLGCVNPNHLRWATPSENAADRRDHGTHIEGSRLKTAKLTEAVVREIREVHATGEFTQKEIAAEVGIHKASVNDIILRKTWKHVA